MSNRASGSKQSHPKQAKLNNVYEQATSNGQRLCLSSSSSSLVTSENINVNETGKTKQGLLLNNFDWQKADSNSAIVSINALPDDSQPAEQIGNSGEARISFIVADTQSGRRKGNSDGSDSNRCDDATNVIGDGNILAQPASQAAHGHEVILQTNADTKLHGDCALLLAKDSDQLDCGPQQDSAAVDKIIASKPVVGFELQRHQQDNNNGGGGGELESAFTSHDDHQGQELRRPLVGQVEQEQEQDQVQNLKTIRLSPHHIKLNPGRSKRVRFKKGLVSSASRDVKLLPSSSCCCDEQSLSPTATTATATSSTTNYSPNDATFDNSSKHLPVGSCGGIQSRLLAGKQFCDQSTSKDVAEPGVNQLAGPPKTTTTTSNKPSEDEDVDGADECDDLLLNCDDRHARDRSNSFWRNRKADSGAVAPEAVSISSPQPRRVSIFKNLVDKFTTYKRSASTSSDREDNDDDDDDEQELFNRDSLFTSSLPEHSADIFNSNNNNKSYRHFNLSTASKRRAKLLASAKSFRGPYRSSRVAITMVLARKLFRVLSERSTLALIGAFLIHITLGTVYTLSNVSSYMVSYMRLHGYPSATYGGSIWISSTYAIGQGFSIVLGGYLERRFSARLASSLGCFIHSMSIIATAKSIQYGPSGVLLTYGLLPGIGCGLAYMTPMSNGFGWYPNRRGLVAGLILAGFGLGTFVFNMVQTVYVNPHNLSPLANDNGYFTQTSVLEQVPNLFVFLGAIYAAMQFVGCCLLFKPPILAAATSVSSLGAESDERPIMQTSPDMTIKQAIRTREFLVLFVVYGITTQGVLFVNSSLKKYGQLFIHSDLYLAWTGSMASIANSLGRLVWGLAIDRYSFTQCFTWITIIFSAAMFLMPFEAVLSSKALYLICTLMIFGSFSGWMSTYPVHISRLFGRPNSGVIYGLIFFSQSVGSVVSALGIHYLVDNYRPVVVFDVVVASELIGLLIYHLFYPKLRDAKAVEQN